MRGLTLLKDYSGERGNYWLNHEIQHQLHTKAILSIKESILVSKGPGGFQPLRKMCNYLGIGKKKFSTIQMYLQVYFWPIFRSFRLEAPL